MSSRSQFKTVFYLCQCIAFLLLVGVSKVALAQQVDFAPFGVQYPTPYVGDIVTVSWDLPADNAPYGQCTMIEIEVFDPSGSDTDYTEYEDCSPRSYSFRAAKSGTYELYIWVRAWNASTSSNYTDYVKVYIDVEQEAGSADDAFPATFESDFNGWINTASDTWRRRSGGTPSGGTGPSSAAAGSYYAYVETSSSAAYYSGDEAVLESPSFSLSGQTVEFKYHMYGSNMGSLYFQVYSGGQWHTLWSRSGQQHGSNSAAWSSASVSLGGYSGTGKVRFRAVAAGGYRGDMAIDQIEMTQPSLSPPHNMNASYSSNPHGLRVSWGSVSGAQRYEVARSVDGGSTWNMAYHSGSSTQFVDTDINNKGSIFYRIRACASSCSSWTNTPSN